MILNRLEVENYSVFASNSFDLTSTPDKPVVLFLGNNGAGKTSLLDALRLVFHGRRAFPAGISQDDYSEFIREKFHNGRTDQDCSILLRFEYSDFGQIRKVDLRRRWQSRSSRIAEDLCLSVDGDALRDDEADDFLSNILPPEMLRYFFFDGEKIKDLAELDREDDSQLFAAVDDLLGLNIVDQLERDLDRIASQGQRSSRETELSTVLAQLEQAEADERQRSESLKACKSRLKAASREYNGARQRFLSLGGLFANERGEKQRAIGELGNRIDVLEDELRREAAAYLPLLAMQRTRAVLFNQITTSTKVETAEAMSNILIDARPRLMDTLRTLGVARDKLRVGADAIEKALLQRPVAISKGTPVLSLREASWMHGILTTEVPRLRERLRETTEEHRRLSSELAKLERQVRSTPTGDPKTNLALVQLEKCHQTFIETESAYSEMHRSLEACAEHVQSLRSLLKKLRQSEFQGRRLRNRDQLIVALRRALPEYSLRLRATREEQFSRLFLDALSKLWQKRNRVDAVHVDLSNRHLSLLKSQTELSLAGLSAAEKQLFAIAFIYAVAKLSNRSLPFVIDTPVGRLDKRHRRNLIVDFLPSLSHQVILFSTDTEIVGPLLRELRPLISHEYDLAGFNGGITQPVQLEVAL